MFLPTLFLFVIIDEGVAEDVPADFWEEDEYGEEEIKLYFEDGRVTALPPEEDEDNLTNEMCQVNT